MGGCFSVPEPANGQPDAAPGENSTCQSVMDLFKKCGFTKRDDGGSDDSIDAKVQKAKDDWQKMEVEMEEIKSENERALETFDEINSILNKNATFSLNQFELSKDLSEAGGTDTDDRTV